MAVKGDAGILAKVHARPQGGMKRTVLALCDKELLGKVFTQGEKILDLKSYKDFYHGDAVSELQAIEMLKQADNANIVGEKSVSIAAKALGFSKTNVKKIDKIPHLQFYKV